MNLDSYPTCHECHTLFDGSTCVRTRARKTDNIRKQPVTTRDACHGLVPGSRRQLNSRNLVDAVRGGDVPPSVPTSPQSFCSSLGSPIVDSDSVGTRGIEIRGAKAKTAGKAARAGVHCPTVAPKKGEDTTDRAGHAHGPVIIIDTREQAPFDFGGRVQTVRMGLETGDYSLAGFESIVTVERKSLPDYVSSLTWQRDRFLRECERLAAFPIKAIVVEGSFGDLVHGKYGTKATPQSLIGSTIKLLTDFGLPVVFCDCRTYAERFVERMLVRHWEHAKEALKSRKEVVQ